MNKKILIVEDHPDIQKILSIVITETYKGINISSALDGDEALSIMKKEKSFSMVFMDIMMPGITGLIVAKKMKEDPLLKKVPIIFFTAMTDQKTLEEARKLGSDVIIKPFDIADIRQTIDKYL